MDKQLTDESLESRRSFIKKAAYAAPAIIALGSITKPVSAAASCGVSTPCGGSTDNSGSSTTENSDPANNDEGGFKGGF